MKRLSGTLCAFLALAMMIATAAEAHQGNPDFRSEITSIAPAALADGIEMAVKNFDDSIELVNRSGRTVTVMGYEGEPYLRFDPGGAVEVNLNSPAGYLNEERYTEGVEVPVRADSKADPDWRKVGEGGAYVWHDHRSHYMADGMPVQVSDPAVETKIFDFEIPMEIDGRQASATGTLTWVGTNSGFPLAPFLALVLIVGAGTVFTVLRRKRRDPAAGEE